METSARHSPPQCPTCGSTDIVHDELISGERDWRCRECGHEWVAESTRPEVPTGDSGELIL
jgi:ribosomal protein L37AE/L43A